MHEDKPLCINCKYYYKVLDGNVQQQYCNHPSLYNVNLVSGAISRVPCFDARYVYDRCGRVGALYEPA